MNDLKSLAAAEARRWSAMHVNPARKAQVMLVAKRLVAPAAKARYVALSASTRVPWFVIAVIHEREASQDWSRSIAQGDRWDRRSVNVPAGRGPFTSFEDAAIDALVKCAPHAAQWTDWSTGGTLLLLEEYNGLGYARKGVPSPYDWAATDQYKSGKYVRDGVYDPNAVDQQLGCAALLACMAELDASVHFDGQTAPTPTQPVTPETHVPPVVAPKITPPTPTPAPKQAARPWWLSLLSALFGALFSRKATQ